MMEENRYSVSKERRIELGNYIKKARLNHTPNKLGLNELAEITNSAGSLISNLENGKIQRINPFLLQDIAKGLEVDYKILYKIVGFLDEEEPSIEEPSERKNSSVIIWEKNEKEVIDISSLSNKRLIELKRYIEFLKIDFEEYKEFLQWKQERKRDTKSREKNV